MTLGIMALRMTALDIITLSIKKPQIVTWSLAIGSPTVDDSFSYTQLLNPVSTLGIVMSMPGVIICYYMHRCIIKLFHYTDYHYLGCQFR